MNKQVEIKRIVVGSYRVNAYLVTCSKTLETAIIDPGGEGELLIRTIRDEGLVPVHILNTHGHADHILANRELAEAFSIKTSVHEEDANFFARPEIMEKSAKELGLPVAGPVDIKLKDGELVTLGSLKMEVLHTPGHTPGSCCFLIEGNLFTGDTLFVGDVGRTDLVGGSLDILLNSIRKKIMPLPETTVIWPGHDYGETPTSTLAWEMRENPYITDFILAE